MTAADPSLTILGPSTLNGLQIGAWFAKKGKGQPPRLHCSISQLIVFYIVEGNDQGVRGDVAFAQAIQETGYFGNPDTSRNNFAGIAHFNNAPAGLDFADPQTGVRAHIQLLYKVVKGNGAALAHPNVTPNWAGKQASTWDGLSQNWAFSSPPPVPVDAYSLVILSIYNDMSGGATPTPAGPTGTGTIPVPTTANANSSLPTPPTATLPPIPDPTYVAQATLDSLVIGSTKLGDHPQQVAELVTGGTIELTASALSQLTFQVVDPDLAILNSHIFDMGQSAQWFNVKLITAAVATSEAQWGAQVELTLREVLTESMARNKGQLIPGTISLLSESGISATDFLARRVAQYNIDTATGIPGAFTGQPTAIRPTIQLVATPGDPRQWESVYDLGRQLAVEEGFWFYESCGGVWFGKPSWLLQFAPFFTVGWNGTGPANGGVDSLNVPACRRSREVITGDEVVVTLPRWLGEQVRLGMGFHMSGTGGARNQGLPGPAGTASPLTVAGGFDGDYLVVKVRWQNDGGATPVEVTGWQPVDPFATAPGGLQQTAGLTTPPPVSTTINSTAGTVPGQYVDPLSQGKWTAARTDQGVDFMPQIVSPVLAIGNGVVTYSNSNEPPIPRGWGGSDFGGFIVYQLSDGTHAGLFIYVAEHIRGLSPVGTKVVAGQQICTAYPGYPWIEMGWAAPSGDQPAVRYNGLPDGTPTSGGKAFARFLRSIGRTTLQDPGPGPDRP